MAHLDYTYDARTKARILPVKNLYRGGGKRCMDVSLSLALLPIILPVIAILCILNALSIGAPLFRHTRVGKDGRPFNCWKLRTMPSDSDQVLKTYLANTPSAADEWSKTQKLTNDPRVTPFGRFLRRSSLDELPQIWNVFRGDMSFVGPRPVTQGELHHYGVVAREYLSVRPGVTGVWQVYGRGNGCYKERVQMDRLYCRAISAHQDVQLIAMTALVLLKVTGK